jgi:hypothetical protein
MFMLDGIMSGRYYQELKKYGDGLIYVFPDEAPNAK